MSQGRNGDRTSPGATNAASASAFSPIGTSRASPFPPTSGATKNAMAASAFMSHSQPFRPGASSQAAYPLSIPAVFDRDATTKPIGTPFGAAMPGPLTFVLIRRLPLNTSEESLRLMVVFSKDLVDVEVLSMEQSEDVGFRSAVLKFKSPAGAQEAKNMLDGKQNISNDAEMIVEILGGSPSSSRRFPVDASVPTTMAATAVSSATSSAPSSRQPSRYNGAFQLLETIPPPMPSVYGNGDLPGADPSRYQSLFSPQSPIGNHLTEQNRISGKSLIKNDSADDDETGELLKDPVAYADAESRAMSLQQRRSTAPHIPVGRMAALSLNAPSPVSSSVPQYGHLGMGSISAHPNAMSPTVMNGNGPPPMGYGMGGQHYQRHNFPPVNPADQNPPCNTLYVGNLPIDTSEEELKAMFSKQRGYKRLCFRTKQNGPMCFVEFEDVSFATKALHELYGQPLHNSVKGGIRLSFSKNPLGVRSGQTPAQSSSSSMGGINGIMAGGGNGFTTANGPPPGLAAPPGLAMNRMNYNGNSERGGNAYNGNGFPGNPANGWNGNFNPAMAAGGPSSAMANSTSNFPSFMMGR